ncbi:hypothetical protein LRP88_01734 [Fusarium phalaenopsidis]
MSLLATYSAVLSKFEYDASVNFWKMDLVPCITDQSPNCCILCAHDKKKCGSIPRELWGAAQHSWNDVHNLCDNVIADPSSYSRCQIWRANRAVKDVAYAWRKVADRLRDPMMQKSKDTVQLARVQAQELASNRELLSLLCLQGAGAQMTLPEMTSRIAAAAPVYIRDDTPAQLLLEAIDRLDGAENTPRVDVEVEGSDRDIMGSLDELYDVADQAVADCNPGPICPISFVGQRPRLRGPADPSSTPGGRKRARPADGGDGDNNDDDDDGNDAPDPSPSRPPSEPARLAVRLLVAEVGVVVVVVVATTTFELW